MSQHTDTPKSDKAEEKSVQGRTLSAQSGPLDFGSIPTGYLGPSPYRT